MSCVSWANSAHVKILVLPLVPTQILLLVQHFNAIQAAILFAGKDLFWTELAAIAYLCSTVRVSHSTLLALIS